MSVPHIASDLSVREVLPGPAPAPVCIGVRPDVPESDPDYDLIFSLPQDLQRIGIRCVFDANGDLSVETQDLAIYLVSCGLDVYAEIDVACVPATLDVPAFVSLLAVSGIGLACVPPSGGGASPDFAAYVALADRVASAWIVESSFSRPAYPFQPVLTEFARTVFDPAVTPYAPPSAQAGHDPYFAHLFAGLNEPSAVALKAALCAAFERSLLTLDPPLTLDAYVRFVLASIRDRFDAAFAAGEIRFSPVVPTSV